MNGRRCLLGVLVAALSLLEPFSHPAAADDAWLNEWRQTAAQIHIAKLTEMLTEERLDTLSQSANELFRAVSCVEQFGGPLSRTHPKAFGVLLDRLYARVSELASKENSATYYRMALAYATATRCRHRVLTGHKKCQPEWLAAADSVAELSAKKRIAPEPGLVAAGWLGEAAQHRAEKHEALIVRAKEIIDAAAAREAKEADLQAALGGWYVARARVGRLKKKKGYGKTAVVDGLAYLKPHIDSGSLSPALATVHMNLVAENRAGKFGVKVDMRLKPNRLNQLFFELPESTEWTVETNDQSGNKSAVQRMLGGAARRTINASSWKKDGSMWVDKGQNTSVALSKPKAVATAMREGFEEYTQIDEVTRRGKVRKGKLHRAFSDVWFFSIEGTTIEQRWMRLHVFYFNTKKGNLTYSLRVTEFQNETELDPVYDFVLKSMRLKK